MGRDVSEEPSEKKKQTKQNGRQWTHGTQLNNKQTNEEKKNRWALPRVKPNKSAGSRI